MANIYLVLALIGAVVPYLFFVDWFSTEGFDLAGFVAGAFANGSAGGFTADVLISSLVFWVWLISRKTPRLWLYVIVNLSIGLSCALPLYLWQHAKDNER